MEDEEIRFQKLESKLNNPKVKIYEMTLEILIFNIFTCIFQTFLSCKQKLMKETPKNARI